MIKLFLASLLTLTCTTAALAQAELRNNPQSAAQVRFRANSSENSGFGIKGGVNFASLNGAGADRTLKDRKGLTQYHFGVYAQIGVSNWFSVQAEALYQRKGYKAKEAYLYRTGTNVGTDSATFDNTIKLSYLSVPILLVFNPVSNIAIQVGPQFSYLLNVREGSDQVDAQTYNYKGFDMGLVGGLEAKFEFLRVGARYDYSLTDLRKEGTFLNATRQANKDIRNGTIQVYIGVGL